MSHYTVTQILTNKIIITTFLLVPVKYGTNFTAAMGIFVQAVKTGTVLYKINNEMKYQ